MLGSLAGQTLQCEICSCDATALDVVDFNRSCEEARNKFLPLSGQPIYYFRCSGCGFCFAPEMANWSEEILADKVYNGSYAAIDPDYLEERPLSNAKFLALLFPNFVPRRHLDYGGGNGLLSRTLKDMRWNSTSYDPYVDKTTDPMMLGSFDLISAFEVFEHVPNIHEVLDAISHIMRDQAVLIFSTLTSDDDIKPNQRLTWWYASPRNGHISLYSKASLATLAASYGFGFVSLTPGLHLFFRSNPPDWASHLMQK